MENSDELIKAQNRTTVFLRAFLSLMQLYLIGSILMGVFVGIGAYALSDPYGSIPPALMFGFAALIAIIFVIAAVVAVGKALKHTQSAESNV